MKNNLALEDMSMTKPNLTGPECADLLDRLAPDWPLLLHDGAVIDHILKVINNARRPHPKSGVIPAALPISPALPRSSENGLGAAAIVACVARSESGSDPVKKPA